MLMHVAFVCHDDEQELVPLGVGRSLKEAMKLCEKNVKEHNDKIKEPWAGCPHSRIKGDFADMVTVTEGGEVYRYHIRPIEVADCDVRG